MKLFSTKGVRKSANKRQRYPVSVIVLVCLVVLLASTLAVIYISAIIRSNQTEHRTGLHTEEEGTGAFAQSSADASEIPEPETGTAAREFSDRAHYASETPPDIGAESGGGNVGGNPTPAPNEPADDTEEAKPLPDEEVGERIILDDSKLLSTAENVYYHVYFFETGDYCTGGDSAMTPSASVIKVFIMEYAFHQNDLGDVDLEEILGGHTILHLITLMIQQSDNDATNRLIDHFGMDNMNAFFLEQGYSDTVL